MAIATITTTGNITGVVTAITIITETVAIMLKMSGSTSLYGQALSYSAASSGLFAFVEFAVEEEEELI